ncbi:IlvD/Edd family dehydratase [uncultured Dechloromonas sp.]|uniref:IlvD/Edd family dehydratase n=1 Tax=uncultured Dechloromonas sp. TaxID=171719 RepID=UPI0025F16D1C|nr:IlvD/Edd family dehydratase [uncultured Dechloromonas sp.]
MPKKEVSQLRSHRWFGGTPKSTEHTGHALQAGFGREEFEGRPVIGIINTWSDMNPCHAHLKDRAEAVKRGVWQAGGFPVELPAMSLGEGYVKPSSMLYRNFLAMETEELLRCHPIDGAILLGGCDKTTPGLLMGAISMNIPTIFCPAGFTMGATFRGERFGSGTGGFRWAPELLAGKLSLDEWQTVEQKLWSSPGTCNVMGTASTMTALAEVLGMSLAGNSSVPAMDSRGHQMAAAAGRRIVQMVWDDIKPSDILGDASFRNAAKTCLALGGSTNAAIHLIALARRAGASFTLEDFDAIGRQVPVLANVQPSGQYIMPEFADAGGLLAMLTRMADLLELDCMTVTGATLGENIRTARVENDDIIRSLDNPVATEALAVLKGNLAPNGCVIKPSASDPALQRHRGRAVVFENADDLAARIHHPDLDVDASCVLVLRNVGPQGGPGMAENGMVPIPKKLVEQGVRDMVRISDARMSGTSFGTCVLHVSPESWIGGPLALVNNGDEIEIDVPARTIALCVDEAELARRRQAWQPPAPHFRRGWGQLFSQHVTQADQGCDFDFLASREPNPEPAIHGKI